MCIQAGTATLHRRVHRTATHTEHRYAHSDIHGGIQACVQRAQRNVQIKIHLFATYVSFAAFFPNLFPLFSTEPPPRFLINKSVCKFCLPPVSLMALGRSCSCGPAIRDKWQGGEQGLGVNSAPLSALAPTGRPAGLLSCADGALRIPISAGEAAAAPQGAGARAQDRSSLFLDPSLGSGLFA